MTGWQSNTCAQIRRRESRMLIRTPLLDCGPTCLTFNLVHDSTLQAVLVHIHVYTLFHGCGCMSSWKCHI